MQKEQNVQKSEQKKKRKAGKIFLIILAALLLLCMGAYIYVIKSYSLTKIQVSGNVHYTKDEVIDIVTKGKKAEEKIAAPPGAATINEDFLELLDQMEQQYRVVLILYYVEEMSIREISQILQMNENTVKTRLSRGRGVYKKLYLKEHPEFQFE